MEEGKSSDEFIVIREGEDKVEVNPDDATLAEELQIQEIIFFFIESAKNQEEPAQGAIDPITEPSDPILEQIDPKGKKPKTTIYITERGESSKTTEETFYCAICMEPNPTLETFLINPCNHIFCNSCIIHYVTAKVEENLTSIRCPFPGCESGTLDPLACQQIISADVFERWSLALCESLLGSNKIYCPYNDCSALLFHEDDKGAHITNSECPHCHRMFCVRCKVAWHGNISCEEFEKLGNDEREVSDLMLMNLAKNSKWQRCPYCIMYVEKTEGCRFMKCRCGFSFCYDCASPMSHETHYCEKCQR